MTTDPYQAFARPDPASLLESRNIGPTIFVTVTTPTVASAETPVIGEALQELVSAAPAGTRHLVLDLEQVKLLTSVALSMLLTTYSAAINQDVRVVLAGVSDGVHEILTTTKLTKLLPVCKTPAELEQTLRG